MVCSGSGLCKIHVNSDLCFSKHLSSLRSSNYIYSPGLYWFVVCGVEAPGTLANTGTNNFPLPLWASLETYNHHRFHIYTLHAPCVVLIPGLPPVGVRPSTLVVVKPFIIIVGSRSLHTERTSRWSAKSQKHHHHSQRERRD